jgi:hypothetical protein
MLKIVDIHVASSVQGEYVVLENQGLVTLSLRGWALCTDAYFNGTALQMADEMYIFREDIQVKPFVRVVLFSKPGQDGWVPTVDGKQAYCAFWGRSERVWAKSAAIHLLHLLTSRRVVVPPSVPASASAPA